MNISAYSSSNLLAISPPVLYIKTDSGMENRIAIRLKIDPNKNSVAWEGTGRGHAMDIKKYEIEQDRVVVLDKDYYRWEFLPLTLDLFNTFKDTLVPIRREFKSSKELQEYYSQTF